MTFLGNAAMEALPERRRFYVSGQPVELWEDSEAPFGWTREDIEGYAVNGAWELLFNALVLNATSDAGGSSVA